MAYITVQTHSVWLSVPAKYRKLIAEYCAQVGTAPDTRWMTGTAPQLWLQLPGVVVEAR